MPGEENAGRHELKKAYYFLETRPSRILYCIEVGEMNHALTANQYS